MAGIFIHFAYPPFIFISPAIVVIRTIRQRLLILYSPEYNMSLCFKRQNPQTLGGMGIVF